MTGLSGNIFAIVDRIAGSPSVAIAWDAFLEAANMVHLQHAIACAVPANQNEDIQVAFEALPKGCWEGYARNGLASGDLVMERVKASHASFHWTLADWTPASMTPEQRRWYEHCRTFRFGGGLSILDFRPGSKMALTAVGHTYDLSTHDRLALCFAGQELLHRLHDIAGNHSAQEWLSARERECLVWASAGKTDWEIGQILSLSEKTVNVYINRAKTKFGVKSRAQAIVRASQRGLIST